MTATRLALAGLFLAATFTLADPPTVGEPAPSIDLPAANVAAVLPDKKDKKRLALADLKGKNVVLWFYPKALTGG
ncbi:MAG: hypothetical protein ACRC33_24000 [Gemmataceae bacterium]